MDIPRLQRHVRMLSDAIKGENEQRAEALKKAQSAAKRVRR